MAETWWRGAFLHRMKIGNPNFLIVMFFDPKKGRTVHSGANCRNFVYTTLQDQKLMPFIKSAFCYKVYVNGPTDVPPDVT